MTDPIIHLNAALQGRYRIEREVGQGGMAVVYLADDLRHERKVALKVLKPELAAVVGAERFLAEIKTTASLQHPHILALHDSGEAAGFVFCVMPYVEGESLRERLDREAQLPVDEAVRIATDVAEALDYAHERGVIHRDIKPANILFQAGRPVIADFGIALAMSTAGGGRLTETGLSLGTPRYMSPEQATGEEHVGAATDTYSLACVLYEMLVGEPPYTGRTPQAILGKIIAGEPESVTGQRRSVPANVDAAIRKALEKLPADRFASVGDFARALGDGAFSYWAATAAGAERAHARWAWQTALPWGLAAGLAATAGLLATRVSDTTPLASMQFSVDVGRSPDVSFGEFRRPGLTSLALSPDGSVLIYSAPSGDPRLHLRRLGQADSLELLNGTEGARNPFFSPDGSAVGFFVGLPEGAPLKRVSLATGTVSTIVQDAKLALVVGMREVIPRGASWGDDGTIVYSGSGGLYSVAEGGGEPVLILPSGAFPEIRGELPRFGQPHVLPGSEVLLFHAVPSANPELAEVSALNLSTGDQKSLVSNAMHPIYVTTGHLVFVRQGTLMAVAFDIDRLEVSGEPVTILEGVMHTLPEHGAYNGFNVGAAQVAISATGHLAYVLGGVTPTIPNLAVRVDRRGEVADTLETGTHRHGEFRISPDGSRIAFHARNGSAHDIWIHDRVRGVTEILPTGGYVNLAPTWSPNGDTIAFTSDRDVPGGNIYKMAADGSGVPERLAPSDRQQYMSSWSREGVIAFAEAGDIRVLLPDGSMERFARSEEEGLTGAQDASFSPDGKWLLYASVVGRSQGERPEVFVRPYPAREPRMRVSSNGGWNAAWSRDGREIFYVELPFAGQDPGGPRTVLAVAGIEGDSLVLGAPEPILTTWPGTNPRRRPYDVDFDGLFIYSQGISDFDAPARAFEIQWAINWGEQLQARVSN